jgi:hypothetical protein
MKFKFYLVSILLVLSFKCFSQGYNAYVFGYVRDSSGLALANRSVVISVDSSNSNTCRYSKTKLTNANGFYSDTLICIVGTASTVRVTTASCNSLISNVYTIPSTRTLEANFRVCNTIVPTPVVKCKANITVQVNNKTAYFSTILSTAGATNDSIVSRSLSFGNGTIVNNNLPAVTYTYPVSGTYNACVLINTARGCSDTACINVVIRDSVTPIINCASNFVYTANKLNVKFNSISSQISSNDSIIERNWVFGDGTTLGGNNINPSKNYPSTGLYSACLTIRTKLGCSNRYCMVIPVVDSITSPSPICKAFFNYVPVANVVQFNSSNSGSSIGDSIVSRLWSFGDSTTLTGNNANPTKTYVRPGVYNVCLKITTQLGCTNTYCATVIATNVPSACIPQYTTERILGTKNIRFNSNMSWVAANDSIVERRWTFGDATTLFGNVFNPLKTYPFNGVYNACLKIRTAKGCVNEYCRTVVVADSLAGINSSTNGNVKIVNLFPLPARTNLAVNIWSRNNNVRCEISIFDIYGVKKWGSVVNLVQGNNIQNVPVTSLPMGPYYIRINTSVGNDSRPFFKF